MLLCAILVHYNICINCKRGSDVVFVNSIVHLYKHMSQCYYLVNSASKCKVRWIRFSVFTWNNCEEMQPCSLKKSKQSYIFDCDAVGECACYWELWPGKQGRKTDYHFHSDCDVEALEVTSELLLPLLDWSCQSCSTHVRVITTAHTSATNACSNEQTQTYISPPW